MISANLKYQEEGIFMNIGKLISKFIVSCVFTFSLAMGTNVNAQTQDANLMRTSATQEKSHKMSKKKHRKHEHKKAHHHRGY
jgi:hypothetical protein